MQLLLPDVNDLDWEAIDKLRNSRAGGDLRRHLKEAAADVAAHAEDITDPRDLTILIQRHYLSELGRAVLDMAPTAGRLVFDIGANLIPMAGAAATAADLANLLGYRNSWRALIRRATD
jgi:hypothetical protein